MLEERAKTLGDEVALFTFDAWTHQGDPLRRMFIERLVLFGRARRWVGDDDFAEELDELSAKKESIRTETRSRPTTLGLIGAATLALLPLGLSLLDSESQRVRTLGFIMAVLPFGILLAAAIRIGLDKSAITDRKSSASEEGPRGSLGDVAGVIATQKFDEVVRHESVASRDPTSREFEDLFREVCSKSMAGHENRRLVVVLDNLDRVDPQEALALWSTMRTFTGLSGPGLDGVWLIAPLDPEALERLWERPAEVASAEVVYERPPEGR